MMIKKCLYLFLSTLLINALFIACTQPSSNLPTDHTDSLPRVDTVLVSVDTLESADTIKFSNVHCMVLINYPKMSCGEYVYKNYTIVRGEHEFRIERKYRNGLVNQRNIPYTKEMLHQYANERDSSTQQSALADMNLGSFLSDNYFSTRETYTVNEKTYTIYKHVDFNCYDPFCGSKHGHTTHTIGETFFSPEYGILISKDEADMEYEILATIFEHEVPFDLIIEIMKKNNMNERILKKYMNKVKSLQGEI